MPEFNLAIIISSFIAGLFTFFAPCTLPLVPAFLGIIAGVHPETLNDPEKFKAARWMIFKNAIAYVIGFSLIFIIFGVAFAYLGTIIFISLWLEKLGGIFIIAFGLFLLGLIKIPQLDSDKKIAVPRLFRHVSLLNSFLLGALFAIGWSPCVGPLLGSILLLATSTGTVLEGTFLLVVFSVGLGIPFLVTSLLVGKAFTAFSRWEGVILIINKIAGAFLVLIGFLLILGKFSILHNQLKDYFSNFQFFEVFINRFL